MKPESSQLMPKAWLTISWAGFSLVEVILASSVFVLLVTALVGSYLYGEESTALAGNRARAVMLADEGLEAVRSIRDAGFSILADGTYGLSKTGNQWNLSGSEDTTDIFKRQIVITSSGLKKKSITSTVNWQQNPGRTGTVSLQTTISSWNGNWDHPARAGSLDLSGNNENSKIQISGNFAYTTRSGGSPNFLVVDLSHAESPALAGSLTLSGQPQNIFVSGNYAYVVTNDIGKELQIINISSSTEPRLVGTFDTPGNAGALGVYVVGTSAYIVQATSPNDEFLIVNVANPTLPTLIGSLKLGNTGSELVVSGNYAYVAASDNAGELKVINISNPNAPVLAKSFDLPGDVPATTIAIAGKMVFLGQDSKFYAINVSTPSSPAITGFIELSGRINDIALNLANDNTYVFLATGDLVNELKVINVTNPTTPLLLSQMNITGLNALHGIAYDPTIDRAFLVSNPITLWSAQSVAVMAASTITIAGATKINGDLALFPGTSITGMGTLTQTGVVQSYPVAGQAQADAHKAALIFSGLLPVTDLSGRDLGGMTLTPGIYRFAVGAGLTGSLTLDFQGNANDAFVFQIGTTLTTAANSSVNIINGGKNEGVYWQLGTSATFGAETDFAGNMLANVSITEGAGAKHLCGRSIALVGAVTMAANMVSNDCTNSLGSGKDDFGSKGFSSNTEEFIVAEPH